MHVGLTVTLVLGLVAQQPAPDAAPDAAETPAPRTRCAESAESAEHAVEAVFSELSAAYRGQLPGPRGEAIRDRKVFGIVQRTVDVDAFATRSLGSAWEGADDDRRKRWREALAGLLSKRYWSRLQDPTPYRMTVERSHVECELADVHGVLRHKGTDERRQVSFALVYRRQEWRLYDVEVDGTSLLQTWRGRFRRILKDGGVDALDEQMEGLKKRYPCPESGCRL